MKHQAAAHSNACSRWLVRGHHCTQHRLQRLSGLMGCRSTQSCAHGGLERYMQVGTHVPDVENASLGCMCIGSRQLLAGQPSKHGPHAPGQRHSVGVKAALQKRQDFVAAIDVHSLRRCEPVVARPSLGLCRIAWVLLRCLRCWHKNAQKPQDNLVPASRTLQSASIMCKLVQRGATHGRCQKGKSNTQRTREYSTWTAFLCCASQDTCIALPCPDTRDSERHVSHHEQVRGAHWCRLCLRYPTMDAPLHPDGTYPVFTGACGWCRSAMSSASKRTTFCSVNADRSDRGGAGGTCAPVSCSCRSPACICAALLRQAPMSAAIALRSGALLRRMMSPACCGTDHSSSCLRGADGCRCAAAKPWCCSLCCSSVVLCT